MDEEEIHRLKALECLTGAESEAAGGRYNNAANRAYYAWFHAAMVAFLRAGYRRDLWSHNEVQALFAGQLVTRRPQYALSSRSILNDVAQVRVMGDYETRMVSGSLARGVLRDARRFVDLVLGGTT